METSSLFGQLATCHRCIGVKQQLSPPNRHVVGRRNAKPNLVSLDGDDGDDDIVTQGDSFAFTPGEYEH